jgi:glucose/arabinose dehydrogenase
LANKSRTPKTARSLCAFCSNHNQLEKRIVMRFVLPVVFVLSLLCVGDARAQKVDESPLPYEVVNAYPKLRMRRPIVLTHDGTGRNFVASQYGVIHLLPADRNIEEAPVYMDMEHQVTYKDEQNEEGFLGLAFHPKFKENGEFFVYYSTREEPQLSIISRFRAEPNSNTADPATEEEVMRIKQPYWNHNGGNLLFGPDGYLYIGLGDGGLANDPHGNGQNLSTILGSMLRIDVDHKDEGKNYAIPKDNPFINKPKARPEIYAYGIRNIWGMSFDPETGLLWAADVGQDIWEEIDIIVSGGNYGWNLREGKHPFGPKGAQARRDLIDPIWEYNHSIGKSITGGVVYRGKKLPGLVGHYLYADYVSGMVWALKYDEKQKRVVANHRLRDHMAPIISFGVDAENEVYLTDSFGFIYELRPVKDE